MSAFIQKHSVYVTALLCVVTFSGCKDGDFTRSATNTAMSPIRVRYRPVYPPFYQSGVTATDTPAGWVTGNLNTRFYRGTRCTTIRASAATTIPRRAAKGRFTPVRRAEAAIRMPDELIRRPIRKAAPQRGFLVAPDLHYEENGGFFRNYGRVPHDQAITGVEPGGKLSVSPRRPTLSRRGEVFADYAFPIPFRPGMPIVSLRRI